MNKTKKYLVLEWNSRYVDPYGSYEFSTLKKAKEHCRKALTGNRDQVNVSIYRVVKLGQGSKLLSESDGELKMNTRNCDHKNTNPITGHFGCTPGRFYNRCPDCDKSIVHVFKDGPFKE